MWSYTLAGFYLNRRSATHVDNNSGVGGVPPSDRDGCSHPWMLTRLSLVPEHQRTCIKEPTLIGKGVCTPRK